MAKRAYTTTLLIAVIMSYGSPVWSKTDTLRVMAYNVLYYGNGCQGPNGKYHDYLKTIVGFTNPDILCLDKMASIPLSKNDKYGTAPYGFADSILEFALNAAFTGRYDHCEWTNVAHSSAMSMVFYDKRKLGYLGIVCTYCNITDFTTYKLYYKDPELAQTHDTTFLYVIPAHDLSGDDNASVRGIQITGEMKAVKDHFSRLPNVISLGDFNVRNSNEPFYQELIAGNDEGFRFYDPPFYPDKKLKYPANWDHNADFAEYFTTSTRQSAVIPNSCGTGGGAKNWYDHIFLSGDIVNNGNHIRYIPYSFRVVGNDGQRYKISINDRNTHVNSSAPPEVIESLYQMSNKYPVMLALEVDTKSQRMSQANCERQCGNILYKSEVSVTNPVQEELMIRFPDDMMGQEISLTCIDNEGMDRMIKNFKVNDANMHIKCKLDSGEYTLKLVCHHNIVAEQKIIKE